MPPVDPRGWLAMPSASKFSAGRMDPMKKLLAMTLAVVLFITPAAAEMPQKHNHWFQKARKVLEAKLARQPITANARNVILFISDGNSIGTNYATRLYMGQQAGGYGDDYVLPHEKFPYLAWPKPTTRMPKPQTVAGRPPPSTPASRPRPVSSACPKRPAWGNAPTSRPLKFNPSRS